jgi:translation initiation factor eIF-2B subunit delta
MIEGPYQKSLSLPWPAAFAIIVSVLVATTVYLTMASTDATPNVPPTPSNPPKPVNDETKDTSVPSKSSTTISQAPSQDQSPKLTGAELKAQKKAEKAARRAQETQKKQVGTAAPANAGGRPDGTKGPIKGLKEAAKEGHKRTGSMTTDVKSVPFRGVQQHSQKASEPPAEDKTVDLFRHLYKSRATTIAGVNKDVHPAVLALGQQMRSYVICGSNARLVATLQAFKRVSEKGKSILSLIVLTLC